MDFRTKATLGVALTALFLLTPFALNNFYQGRYLLGIGSLAIVASLAFNAWSCTRGRYRPSLTLFILVPVTIVFLAISIRTQGVIGVLWCYPALLAYYFMLPERQAWLASAALLAVAIPEAWPVLEPRVAVRMAVTLVGVSIFSAIFVRVIADQQRRLEAQALTDPLTGLSNRTRLHATMDDAIAQGARTGVPMTLVVIDLDHFKAINDTHGHDAGDRVLARIGELLRQRIRRSDRAFRLGGEEFLALLYGTDADNARRVAEELRAAIAALPLVPGRPVTVSVGVAAWRPGEPWSEWIKRGDENLYRAKSGGRNRVAV
jgi:diguanylate cyclase (GGDEF)-like protein